MPYTLEQFCTDARTALAEDEGPSGREKLARHLEKLLVDPDFVAEHLALADLDDGQGRGRD